MVKILFNCEAKKNGPEFRDMLCNQLKGNPDFVRNSIVVSDLQPNLIGLYIYQDCETGPDITIDL